MGNDLGFLPETHDLLQSVFAHIIRNAIRSAERLANGERREGLVSMVATHEADSLHIFVRDDGRGLNLQDIRDTAMAKGLLRADETPTREQLSRMIFKANFFHEESRQQHLGPECWDGSGRDLFEKFRWSNPH